MPRTAAQNKQIRQTRTQQILEAARKVFAEQGFHNTRMSDIAQAIGSSQGTLYHYYRSKDELFLAVLNVWNEQIEAIVKQLPQSDAHVTDKFWLVNQLAVSFFETGEDLLPVLVEYWAYLLHNPAAAAGFKEFFLVMQQSFKDIIREGIAAGEFKPVDVELASALPLIILDGVTLLTAILGQNLMQPAEQVKLAQQLVFEGFLTKPEATA
ncbi:MAG: TetR/AcrR family transcriptional regulator [Anaerolineae bacterium]|nr:TetR/AcrR family transcriptional regulator [Anaerolineae bacterium]